MPRRKPATTPEPEMEMEMEADGSTRSLWSGTLSFGLVSIPVHVFPAVRRTRSSLRMMTEDGTPLSRRYYCPKHEKYLEWEEIVRGYPVGADRFVVVTDEELSSLEPKRSRDIDLSRFVPAAAIGPVYFRQPYFLVPGEGGGHAYRLLAEAMQKSRKAGIARFVMRGTEYLVAILAESGILHAETLRFPDEVRSPDEVGLPAPQKPNPGAVRALKRQIGKLSRASLDRSELTDEHARLLARLAEDKARDPSNVVTVSDELRQTEAGAQIVDLLEVLKNSLSRGVPVSQAASGAGSGAAARRSARSSQSRLANEKKEELYERAKSLGIEGRSKMTKRQLESAIRKAG